MFSTKLLIAALAFAGSQATRLEVSDGHRKDYHGKGLAQIGNTEGCSWWDSLWKEDCDVEHWDGRLAQIEDKGCDAWFAWNCDGWGDEIFFSQIDSQRKADDGLDGRGHMKKP